MKSPKTPDPFKTAAAQSGLNRDTAITEQQLNMMDQNNPWGTIEYDRTGTDSFVNSQGQTIVDTDSRTRDRRPVVEIHAVWSK